MGRGNLTRTMALAAALAALAAPAWAQVKPGSETGLGLTGADIPQLLKDIKAEPYKAWAAPACDTIPTEIAAINDLIGRDVDYAPPKTDATTDMEQKAMKGGASMVRGLVPYGGVFRFVTGANKKDDALREAILAAYARRGFLRGVQASLRCPASTPAAEPKPPPEPAKTEPAR
jgi:hypothetical protein